MTPPTPYFYLLTLQLPLPGGGFTTKTVGETVDVSPGGTRRDLFDWVLGQLPEEWRASTVLFFSAEPNVLVPAASAVVRGSAK